MKGNVSIHRLFLLIVLTTMPWVVMNAQGCEYNENECDNEDVEMLDGNYVPLEATIYNGEEGCDERPWVLVFEDDFEGNSLNMQFWNPVEGVPRGQPNAADCAASNLRCYLKPENCVVQNGFLYLQGKNEPLNDIPYSWWDPISQSMVTDVCDFSHTSGEINSKFNFWRGAFEIKCEVPAFTGAWPSFWIFGGNPNYELLDEYDNEVLYQEMISANEVDFFEIDGECTEKATMTTHLWYDGEYCRNLPMCDTNLGDEAGVPPCCNDGGSHFVTEDNFCGDTDYAIGMHTFTCVWDPFILEFWIDGELRSIQPRFRSNIIGQRIDCSSINSFSQYVMDWTFPFLPAQLIAGLTIHSGNNPTLIDIEDSSLKIDYIRFYGKFDCEDKVFTDLSYLDYRYPNLYQYVTGNSIVLADGSSLPDNTYVTFVATGEVNFEPGFTTGTNSDYDVEIVELSCDYGGMVTDDTSTGSKKPLIREKYNLNSQQPEISARDIDNPQFSHVNKAKVQGQLPSEIILTVYSIDGKIVYSVKVDTIAKSTIELPLSSGLYIFEYCALNGNLLTRNKIAITN